MVAVCPHAHGVAGARVHQDKQRAPVLDWARYVDGDLNAGLERLAREPAAQSSNCTSLVDIGDYSLMLIDKPSVPASELRQAVRWQVKDLLDFPIDDAVVDIFDVDAQSGNRIYAVAARSSHVRQRIEQLEQAGFDPRTVDIPEFAIRNIAALLPEDAGGVGVINLGERDGLITLTRQDTLYLSRRIDVGSERLLANGAVMSEQTEGLLDAIVIEVQRSLDYYESHFSQPPVQAVVVAPLATEIPGMVDYLGAQLGVNVRSLDVNELLDTAEPLDQQTQFQCLTAIGAALRDAGAAA